VDEELFVYAPDVSADRRDEPVEILGVQRARDRRGGRHGAGDSRRVCRWVSALCDAATRTSASALPPK